MLRICTNCFRTGCPSHLKILQALFLHPPFPLGKMGRYHKADAGHLVLEDRLIPSVFYDNSYHKRYQNTLLNPQIIQEKIPYVTLSTCCKPDDTRVKLPFGMRFGWKWEKWAENSRIIRGSLKEITISNLGPRPKFVWTIDSKAKQQSCFQN